MLIVLVLDRFATRAWHVEVISALERQPGVRVGIRWSGSPRPGWSADVERLLRVERRLHGVRPGRSSLVSPDQFLDRIVPGDVVPDSVLDLSSESDDVEGPTLRLAFDGQPGELGLLAALLDGRTPVVDVVDVGSGIVVASGRPGSDAPSVVVVAIEDTLATTTQILVGSLGDASRGPMTRPVPASLTRARIGRHVARLVARAAVHRVYRLMYRAPHWRVGWRVVNGPDVIDLLAHPESGWQELPDDGYHFYADPFPVVQGDTAYVFVEDYAHRLGRAVISVVPFDRNGARGAPRPVLEHRVHMSYPQVFDADGQVWMVPETSAAGTVELYRAERFPDVWKLEAILLDGLEASDATIFRHERRWWMAATVRDGGSYSDALHLWSADAVTGPWRPHERNPVLIDMAAARPAGHVVSRNGRLIRPAQDGRAGYGAALVLAEITQLDDAGFEQRIIGRIEPGDLWAGTRLHTLNRSGWLECIDGSALSPRLDIFPTGQRS